MGWFMLGWSFMDLVLQVGNDLYFLPSLDGEQVRTFPTYEFPTILFYFSMDKKLLEMFGGTFLLRNWWVATNYFPCLSWKLILEIHIR